VAEDNGDPAAEVAFIDAQAKRLKKLAADELPALKLSRAVAALADLTDQAPPDDTGAEFLTAWKRTDTCHHLWGPTVGRERFCTKCQAPRRAVAEDSPRPARPPRS